MLVRSVLDKINQLKSLGLRSTDYQTLEEMVTKSYNEVPERNQMEDENIWKYINHSNYDGVVNVSELPPYTITYNISPEELSQYNMFSIQNALPQSFMGYTAQNPIIVMNNSSPSVLNNNLCQEAEPTEISKFFGSTTTQAST